MNEKQNVRDHVTENAVIDVDVNVQGVAIVNIENVAEIEIETVNVIVNVIVIAKGNVITVNHIHERDHVAEKENVSVIESTENVAERRGKRHLFFIFISLQFVFLLYLYYVDDNLYCHMKLVKWIYYPINCYDQVM